MLICLSTQCEPPLVVTDLFEDIKDGVILLALLEVLSGQTLPCEQGKKLRRIHWVANIGTALNFLEGRKIKLVNINSTDIVDGRPAIVLGLVWTIILYFQPCRAAPPPWTAPTAATTPPARPSRGSSSYRCKAGPGGLCLDGSNRRPPSAW
ncbi:hypothetical protein CRUP_007932 [Coryphaenoides rupestris]|nr:hypothetical protein CRUP_007932 [Coryphaenoides rupestris]